MAVNRQDKNMAEGAIIKLNLRITGREELASLNADIKRLNQNIKAQNNLGKVADAQQKKYTKELQQSNKMMKAKVSGDQRHFKNIAKELNLQQDLSEQYETKIEIERRVLRAKETATAQGQKFNEASARSTIENSIKEEMAYKRVQGAINAKRKALMQASISLFVMNISLNQMVTSFKPLVKGNEDASKAIDEYSAVLNMTLGPMQAYMALQQLSINLDKKKAKAVKGALASMTVMFLMYKAITAEATSMKIVFASLGLIMAVLTAKQISASIATIMHAGSMATLKAVMGNMTAFAKLGIGIGLTGLAVGAIGALSGTFQTPIGGTKQVGRTGLAMVHEGEIFSRPSLSTTNNQSMVLNMNFGAGITRDDGEYIAQTVNRAIARGKGSMTSGGVSLG